MGCVLGYLQSRAKLRTPRHPSPHTVPLSAAVCVGLYTYTTVALDVCAEYKLARIAQLYLRNLGLLSAFAGGTELRTFTHTPHPTGWHTRIFELVSEAYRFVRALGPISGCRRSNGGSAGDRSERYPRADRNLAPTPFAGSGRCR